MSDAHSNFAQSLVATAPSPASSGTSLVVTAGEGTKFPAAPFNATVWPAATQPTTANAEIVRVTNISTDTLTITRAQESSSARTVVVGDQIAATITAKTLTDVETADAAAGTASLRTLGTSATSAAAGNDTRLAWNTGLHSARPAAGTAGRPYYETDTGVLYRDTGSVWQATTVGQVRKTADEIVNNSGTLQDDNHLFFPIDANEVWFVEALLLGTAASINADWLFGWSGPSGATASWGAHGSTVTGTIFGGLASTSTPPGALPIGSTATLGARAGTVAFALSGWFTAAATAGTITFRWSQSVATVEDNTILANSLLRLRKLA